MKTTTTTAARVNAEQETRARAEAAAENASRAAAASRRLRETAAEAVRALAADLLPALAADLETAAEIETETARRAAETRAAWMNARRALRAADLLEYSAADPDALRSLAAASTRKAAEHLERDTGADARALVADYGPDAEQETASRLLAMILGDPDRPDAPLWIDGEYIPDAADIDPETGEARTAPRADMPLALMAARAAAAALRAEIRKTASGRALLTKREAREHYSARETEPEAVTPARRLVDPASPGPESALLQADRLAAVFAELDPGQLDRAAALAREVYAGAFKKDGQPNLREAARRAGIPQRTALRTWDALQAAAKIARALDRDDARTEARIESDARTAAAADARRADAAEARRADALRAMKTAPSGAVRFTVGRPDRLARTAKAASSEDLQNLLRALFYNAAE